MPNYRLDADTISYILTGGAAVLRVTTKEETTRALSQRTLPIIIQDKKRAWLFELLWRVSNWTILATLVAYAISQQYHVEFRLTEWRSGVTTQHEIILVPTTRPSVPSPGLSEE